MLMKKSDGSLKKKKHKIDEEVQPVRNESKKRKSDQTTTVETVADSQCDQSRITEESPSPAKKERKHKTTDGKKSTSEAYTVKDAEGEDRKKSKKEKQKKKSVRFNLDEKATEDNHGDESSETVENPPILKKKRNPNSAEGNKAKDSNAATTNEGATEDDNNIKKKRKKKKKKKKPVIPKDQDLMSEKCTSYLKEWKENRSAWKFQKLFQIWLIQNMFDDSRVPEDIFPVFLEYISGAKGQTVKVINEKATKVIEEAEKNEAELDDPKLVRARSVIQSVVID